MPEKYSSLNLNKVRQLRQFKIDYSRVRNLEYFDKDKMKPQSFSQYRRLVVIRAMRTRVQPRPRFPSDLRYLQNYSSIHFPRGRILILVNHALYPSIRNSINQYIKDVA